MPQAADITINNGAGTPVAKTFTLYSPAGGFNAAAAEWALKEGTIKSIFPVIKASAMKQSGAQKAHWTLRIPSSYTDTVSGLTKVGSAANCEVIVTIPDDYPESLKNDFTAFAKNLAAHALFQASIRDGLPCT